MQDSPLRFDDYWLLFVRAHERAIVRRVQAVAVTAGLGCAALGVVTRKLGLVVAAPAVALVPTWVLRRLGRGAELPFHPAFHVVASLKMWSMTLASSMDAEVARVADASRETPSDLADDDRSHPPPNMVTDHTLH